MQNGADGDSVSITDCFIGHTVATRTGGGGAVGVAMLGAPNTPTSTAFTSESSVHHLK